MDNVIEVLYRFEDIEVREAYDDLPRWIDADITAGTVAGILEGGVDSGAYMSAVTYHIARKVMSDHGDAVLDYLEASGYGISDILESGMSWSGIAVRFLSVAVEDYMHTMGEEIAQAVQDKAFTDAVEDSTGHLTGLDNTVVESCPRCPKIEDYGNDEERYHDEAREPSFSWQRCESCNSRLGGDRHPMHGFRPGEHTDIDNVVHYNVCSDCLFYHTYGDMPELGHYQT